MSSPIWRRRGPRRDDGGLGGIGEAPPGPRDCDPIRPGGVEQTRIGARGRHPTSTCDRDIIMATKPSDDGRAFDSAGQAEIEGRKAAPATGTAAADPGGPPAGPHETLELTDPLSTAGSGALPSATPDGEADAATG